MPVFCEPKLFMLIERLSYPPEFMSSAESTFQYSTQATGGGEKMLPSNASAKERFGNMQENVIDELNRIFSCAKDCGIFLSLGQKGCGFIARFAPPTWPRLKPRPPFHNCSYVFQQLLLFRTFITNTSHQLAVMKPPPTTAAIYSMMSSSTTGLLMTDDITN